MLGQRRCEHDSMTPDTSQSAASAAENSAMIRPTIHDACIDAAGGTPATKANATDLGTCANETVMPANTSTSTCFRRRT